MTFGVELNVARRTHRFEFRAVKRHAIRFQSHTRSVVARIAHATRSYLKLHAPADGQRALTLSWKPLTLSSTGSSHSSTDGSLEVPDRHNGAEAEAHIPILPAVVGGEIEWDRILVRPVDLAVNLALCRVNAADRRREPVKHTIAAPSRSLEDVAKRKTGFVLIFQALVLGWLPKLAGPGGPYR